MRLGNEVRSSTAVVPNEEADTMAEASWYHHAVRVLPLDPTAERRPTEKVIVSDG